MSYSDAFKNKNKSKPMCVLDKYSQITLLFMKLIAIPDISAIYYWLFANIYKSEVIFMQTIDDGVAIVERMNHAKYMHFKFIQTFLSKEFVLVLTINSHTQVVTFNVPEIEPEMMVRVETIMEKMAFDYVKSDMTIVISEAFEAVATGYYTGIGDYLSIDKKLAVYHQYAYYQLSKPPNGVHNLNLYEKLFEMYLDACDDRIEMDIVLHSLFKLKKINKNIDLDVKFARGEREMYHVISTIIQSYDRSGDRNHVASTCMACGATRKLKKCARCKVARFCNTDCVQKAWVAHKPHCKEWSAT